MGDTFHGVVEDDVGPSPLTPTQERILLRRWARDLQTYLSRRKRRRALDSVLTARIKRSVEVEQYLFDAARGKKPLPDAQKCRDLANTLGVSDEYRGRR